MKKFFYTVVFYMFLGAFSFADSVEAQVYKCKDPSGKVLYQSYQCHHGDSEGSEIYIVKYPDPTEEQLSAAKAYALGGNPYKSSVEDKVPSGGERDSSVSRSNNLSRKMEKDCHKRYDKLAENYRSKGMYSRHGLSLEKGRTECLSAARGILPSNSNEIEICERSCSISQGGCVSGCKGGSMCISSCSAAYGYCTSKCE